MSQNVLLRIFFNPTGFLHIYYGFRFCCYVILMCTDMCVSESKCVLCAFSLAPFLLFVCFVLLQLVCFCFIIIMLLMPVCFLTKKGRKSMDLDGRWETSGKTERRENYNQNTQYEKKFSIKNIKILCNHTGSNIIAGSRNNHLVL